MGSETRWIGTCRESGGDEEPRVYRLVEILYDGRGRKLEERHFRPSGELDRRHEHAYDEAGRRVEERLYLGDGSYHGRWVFTHEGERLSRARWIDREGEARAEDRYEYSEDGRSAVRVRDGVGEWRHRYDEAGREVEVSGARFSDGLLERVAYEYDEAGRLARMVRTHATRQEITFAPAAGV